MYQALYRKYRPSSFDDVISQPHITETLKNEIITGKTAHAYIFTGSRGTGKTTCARILAKALVCEHPVNGEPCLECDNCRDMDSGALSDIIEIDAASNGGVDDARDLREAAGYTPERCRYRIYIIDEVHMLSKDAFNALLKIIEEPPPHVKFIMATTEIHKVLPTILSRCQRFDFRRIRAEDIADRIEYIASKEDFTIDREAAELIARAADGGMRDALSILDQCAAFSDNITPEVVSEASGLAGMESVFVLTEALLAKNTASALEVVEDVYSRSKDLSRLAVEMIGQLRNVLVIKNVPRPEGLISASAADMERLVNIAQGASEEQILFALDEFGKLTERLGRSMSKRVELEMTIIRVCKGAPAPAASADPALTEKIARLEQTIAQLRAGGMNNSYQSSVASPRRSNIVAKEVITDTSKMDPNAIVPLAQWAEILEKFGEVCPAVKGTLHGSKAYESNDILLIVTDNNFFLQLLRNKENAQMLRQTISEVTGRNYKIRAKCTAAEDNAAENKLPSLLEKAAGEGVVTEVDN
ncbi:MAG: DNA polymerase III subunit gamma/tau [Oscillospiraceae bacterium]|nr:DNA polymerase III subunit gamma/tau [Oscillospiraceae bacterium]